SVSISCRARSRSLELTRSVLGVPVALEIGNERGAEMTIGLLARIDRAITAEQIERLLRDPECAAIADGSACSRTRQAVDHAFDCGIHAVRRGNLIADEAAFRAVADEFALVLAELAG